ncbi:hypothetical protein BMEGG_06105 [Priestia megaterium]|uniref:SLATT domain-containing protein n=1 Tax=Priestia megaterium TaxID=1404 RepID=UPI002F724092
MGEQTSAKNLDRETDDIKETNHKVQVEEGTEEKEEITLLKEIRGLLSRGITTTKQNLETSEAKEANSVILSEKPIEEKSDQEDNLLEEIRDLLSRGITIIKQNPEISEAKEANSVILSERPIEEKSDQEDNLLEEIRDLLSRRITMTKQNPEISETKEANSVILSERPIEGKSDQEDNLLKEIKDFKDNKVWVTKKTRMESEARMNKNNIFSLIIVNYYTLIVLSLSIWGLVITNQKMIDKIGLLTVISSVALFGISLFVSVFGFKEKAISFKQCYLDLSKIENQFEDILLDNHLAYSEKLWKFNEVKKEYNHILEKTDNHSFGDRLVYLKNNKKINTMEDQLAYIKYKFGDVFSKVLLVVSPVILVIFLFLGSE